MSEWHYKVLGEIVGPISANEMRELAQSGRIERNTLVRKGTGQWIEADRVKGLFEIEGRPAPEDLHLGNANQERNISCPFCSSDVQIDAAECPACSAKLCDVKYIYRMQQLSQGIEMPIGVGQKGNEAANYLEQVVNNWAKNGWEFYRVDEFSVSLPPGCLASLLGVRETRLYYYVVTFRKPFKRESSK